MWTRVARSHASAGRRGLAVWARGWASGRVDLPGGGASGVGESVGGWVGTVCEQTTTHVYVCICLSTRVVVHTYIYICYLCIYLFVYRYLTSNRFASGGLGVRGTTTTKNQLAYGAAGTARGSTRAAQPSSAQPTESRPQAAPLVPRNPLRRSFLTSTRRPKTQPNPKCSSTMNRGGVLHIRQKTLNHQQPKFPAQNQATPERPTNLTRIHTKVHRHAGEVQALRVVSPLSRPETRTTPKVTPTIPQRSGNMTDYPHM